MAPYSVRNGEGESHLGEPSSFRIFKNHSKKEEKKSCDLRMKNGHDFRAREWSGLRGSNPPPRPWQGRALPNELNPQILPYWEEWCLRSELNQRHEDFQSSALPTELQRRKRNRFRKTENFLATRRGLEPLTSSVTG